jgi:hypothetical protein
MHPLPLDIDLAFVSRSIQTAELRVRDELLCSLIRQVAIAPRHVNPADA